MIRCEKCKMCNKLYDISPFACMTGNGERADSQIEIYGDKYNLCPQCTHKIYVLLTRGNE